MLKKLYSRGGTVAPRAKRGSKGMLKLIENDLYDISSRLKEIDEDYFIVYNLKRGRYEVHQRRQPGGSYCLTVPYGELDARTVELVKRTRRQYREDALKDIERHNAKIGGKSHEDKDD
jgi:hypothetical protein